MHVRSCPAFLHSMPCQVLRSRRGGYTHLGPQLSSLWIIVVSQAKGELSGDSILARNEPASWSQFPGTPWLGGVLNKSPLPNDCLCPAHSGGEPQLDMGPYKHS
eukprot:scaffold185278_cov18-Tisochrysis_lutea.AAC.1